jgi:hypothetical protein
MIGPNLGHTAPAAEATFGAVMPLSAELAVIGQLLAGATFGTSSDLTDSYGAPGVRGGFEGSLSWSVMRSLAIEAGLGYDFVRAFASFPPTSLGGNSLLFGHVDIGVRWVP